MLRKICSLALFTMAGFAVLRCTSVPTIPTIPTPLTLPQWDPARFAWPMYGQNVRRTGQSPFNGPVGDPHTARSWSYSATGGGVINIQAVVSNAGAYFGTWGLLRRDITQTPDQWDKSDGRLYGLKLTAQASASAQQLFGGVRPGLTPAGYLRAGRTKLTRDVFWVGAGNDYLVSFYNGTIEGTPCMDPDDGTLYVGRGDGRLYAMDPTSGAVRWTFQTFNPVLPDDPDGGGEIIGGPVMGAGKVLYFGTVGLPWPSEPPGNPGYETNAIYAVGSNGTMLWRYPSSSASLSNWVYTPPAISLDGRTLYVGTFGGDLATPGRLLALDLSQPADATDAQRLKWEMSLKNTGRLFGGNVYVRLLAVGVDGRVYCGGTEPHFFGTSPAVFAVNDLGSRGEYAWASPIVEPQGYPSTTGQFCNGVALREAGGQVETLFASMTHLRDSNLTNGGALYAIDPRDGRVRYDFNPSTLATPGIGGMTAPTLGADGTVYVGVRGTHPAGTSGAVNGRMYAVRYDAAAGFSLLWEYEVDGQMDWTPPAIGAGGGLYFGTAAAYSPVEQIVWYGAGDAPAQRSPRFYGLFDGGE